MRGRAFTLIELLVVLGTILIVAAILFPVFASARASAKRINCISNFHQVQSSSLMYTGDYDEKFMLSTHAPGMVGNSTNDRTWVQLTLPYVRSFDVFFCPADHTRSRTERVFEPDAIPGDPYGRFYTASKRSNVGYNWLYMSPVVMQAGRWMSSPRTMSFVENPAATILFVDSVNTIEGGRPSGGGHHIITPPCRYIANTSREDADSFSLTSDEQVFYTPQAGWTLTREGAQWGHVWPWHDNKANVARLDGSIRSMNMRQLYSGCTIGPDWSGSIQDPSSYIWDLR